GYPNFNWKRFKPAGDAKEINKNKTETHIFFLPLTPGFRRSAVSSIQMGDVQGEIVFTQLFPTFPVMVSGRVKGLAPGEHAFHIHEFGDLREGCLRAGDHFNPFHRVSEFQLEKTHIFFLPLTPGFRRSAVSSIQMGDVQGEIVFTQLFPTFPVMVSGRVKGLAPGEHAFHIHEFGDLREGCLRAGDHFNPFHSVHAAPSSLRRHVGDLGNIIADNDGVARVSILDHRLTLYGPFSILGRAVVVHDGRDDFGVGGNPYSLSSGNAGNRLACGVIGGGRR
ncbi:unnamed protein product, partial [Notodromas monacha]